MQGPSAAMRVGSIAVAFAVSLLAWPGQAVQTVASNRVLPDEPVGSRSHPGGALGRLPGPYERFSTMSSIEVTRRPPSDRAAAESLKHARRLPSSDSGLLVGDWVHHEGITRFLRLDADGSFLILSWPWAFSGRYEDDEQGRQIRLNPSTPLYFGVTQVSLEYEFFDDDHVFFRDPDADIFLASGPLAFERIAVPLGRQRGAGRGIAWIETLGDAASRKSTISKSATISGGKRRRRGARHAAGEHGAIFRRGRLVSPARRPRSHRVS